MEQLIQEWRASLPKFREMTEKFYAKEVSVKEYKGFSGGYGSYAQKGGEASMLRLRMPGGRLTKEKLKFIAEMVEQYHVDKAHLRPARQCSCMIWTKTVSVTSWKKQWMSVSSQKAVAEISREM